MKIILSLFVVVNCFAAVKLVDTPFYNYDVIFTNPICNEYTYDESEMVVDNEGTPLRAKPKNVYCKNEDKEKNELREGSVQQRLETLLTDNSLKKIFLTYLSFSNDKVKDALCEVAKKGVEIQFIIDSKNENRSGARQNLDELTKCFPEGKEYLAPKVYFRGNVKGLGYAHNKIILAEYKNTNKVNIVYGSANMSSGTSMHHENWHFVTTAKETYFYAYHECIRDGMLDAASKSEYKKMIKACRAKIPYEKESDIETFTVPSDGKVAMKRIIEESQKARSMKVAVHRFSHKELIQAMIDASKAGKLVQFISDDDIHWTGVRKVATGFNSFLEFANVMKIVKEGVEVRYMQTNQNHRFLHHNKYILFEGACDYESVFAGAGNFTGAAFSKNYENYYLIKIPSIVKAFKKQYNHVFYKLATKYEHMPKQYVMP